MLTAVQCSRGRAARGFTLVELMVVVLIMVTLSVMAAPVMNDMATRHKLDRLRAELIQSLQEARWEAVARGTPVTLARVTGCSTPLVDGADWSCGWVAFVDLDGDRVQGPTEVRLQVVAVPAGIRLSKPTSPTDSQQFNGFGQSTTLGQRFDLVPTDPDLVALSGSICFSTGTRFRYREGAGSC
jgi:type IV fimbrial biogenesis protein FimT